MALVECGKQLSAEVNIDELLVQILNTAAQLTDSPDGSVLLYDEERLGLYFASAIGESAPMLVKKWGQSSNQRVPLKGSKAGVVFTPGEALVVDSLEADKGHYKGVDQQTQRKTNSLICVPLNFADERIGEQTNRKLHSAGSPTLGIPEPKSIVARAKIVRQLCSGHPFQAHRNDLVYAIRPPRLRDSRSPAPRLREVLARCQAPSR